MSKHDGASVSRVVKLAYGTFVFYVSHVIQRDIANCKLISQQLDWYPAPCISSTLMVSFSEENNRDTYRLSVVAVSPGYLLRILRECLSACCKFKCNCRRKDLCRPDSPAGFIFEGFSRQINPNQFHTACV